MARRVVLGILFCGIAIAIPGIASGDQTTVKPNILVIVADDLGYADLGCQGCKDIPTPNIDSLAAAGIRATNGYVSSPVCSPTRAALMTGRYQQRSGHEFNPGPPATASAEFGLAPSELTLAERLKPAGYMCGIVGKWHLGYKRPYHPVDRGFDEFFGFLAGAHSYLDTRDQANPILRGLEPVESVTYLTDMLADEAANFVRRHASKPWCLFLTFNAVHTPMHTTEAYMARVQGIEDPLRQQLAAMLVAMDDGVGKVLDTVRQQGLEEKTLIFFVSDNGGPTRANASLNTPLRGFKGQVYEGGIRVPFLIQWKGKLPAGEVYHEPIMAIDIVPTALAAAQISVKPDELLDGVNLIPYLMSEKSGSPHDALYWRFGAQWAIRCGDWKLLDPGTGTPELYNLREDISEQNDVAAKYPDKVAQLRDLYEKWSSQMSPPRWGQPIRRPAAARQQQPRAARPRAANSPNP